MVCFNVFPISDGLVVRFPIASKLFGTGTHLAQTGRFLVELNTRDPHEATSMPVWRSVDAEATMERGTTGLFQDFQPLLGCLSERLR